MGAGALREPSRHAQDVERGGDEQVQEPCFGEAAVARPAQVAEADPLGDRPFDPRPGAVPLAELRCVLAPPRVVERLVQRPGADGERALTVRRHAALAGRGPARGFPFAYGYDSYDVTPDLLAGKNNVIAVLANNLNDHNRAVNKYQR